jgi:hypothetical protein
MVSFPITLAHTIVRASIMEGFTFQGIMDDPGCTAGRVISCNQASGPELINLRSFPILIRSFARWLSADEIYEKSPDELFCSK